MTSKGCAFLMDMGTGKTITTIALAGTLHHKHKITQMLVVCPKSIVDVWEQEFEKFADFPYQLAVLDGTSAKKADTIRYMIGNGLQIIVVNYESCWRLEAELTRWHPDMIVCDESSKIKNPQAKCSKALHRLGKISSYNLILTGTPITNSPLDFFSQYKFLDESIFGGSFYGFRAYYAILGGFQNHQIVGYKHLAELVEKAHSIAYRIRIDEAVDLPEFVEEVRPVKLEQNAQKIYDGIEKDSFAELMNGEITTRNVLTQLLRLSQITGGFVRNDDGDDAQQLSTAKLDALEDVIDSCMEEGKKVIVFARFVPEIDAIARMQLLRAYCKKHRPEMVSFFDTVQEFRKWAKIKSTYIDGYLKWINPATGRIHPDLLPMGTDTGRFASRRPNLQNMPRKGSDPIGVRQFVVAPEGTSFLDFDFSQIELRVGAFYCRDPRMMETYRSGGDIHASTTSVIFGISVDEAQDKDDPDYKERRTIAKNVNFGTFYGLFPRGLQRTLKFKAGLEKTEDQCARIIANLKTGYPRLSEWQEETVRAARINGYSETSFGRRRYLPNINNRADWGKRSFAERCSMNTPIQGTAAEILKLAMAELIRELADKPYIRPILQIHDELLFEVDDGHEDEAIRIIRTAMERQPFAAFDIPIVAEGEHGTCFGKLHELEVSYV